MEPTTHTATDRVDIDLDHAALMADLVAAGQRSNTPFGLYVIPSADPAAELARAVERDVFFEYFGNTAEMLAAEYDPYEASSVHLCVVDHLRGQAAGAMRLILPSAAGLKTSVDLEASLVAAGRRGAAPDRARAPRSRSGTSPPSPSTRTTGARRRTGSSAWPCTRE